MNDSLFRQRYLKYQLYSLPLTFRGTILIKLSSHENFYFVREKLKKKVCKIFCVHKKQIICQRNIIKNVKLTVAMICIEQGIDLLENELKIWKNHTFPSYESSISLKICKEPGIHCMPCASKILSAMIHEIHTMKKSVLFQLWNYKLLCLVSLQNNVLIAFIWHQYMLFIYGNRYMTSLYRNMIYIVKFVQ